MSYSINKLDPLIMPDAKPSIVAVGVRTRAGGAGGWAWRGWGGRFIVSVTLNDIAAALRVMKTTSKVI